MARVFEPNNLSVNLSSVGMTTTRNETNWSQSLMHRKPHRHKLKAFAFILLAVEVGMPVYAKFLVLTW
jgi:hypothetical protein